MRGGKKRRYYYNRRKVINNIRYYKYTYRKNGGKENMSEELRPTPILRGKAAKRFYRHINDKEISDEQKSFINNCVKVLEDCSKL